MTKASLCSAPFPYTDLAANLFAVVSLSRARSMSGNRVLAAKRPVAFDMAQCKSAPITLSKRAFDLAAILVTAPATVPLGLGIAVLVKVFDGGPVLLRTRRVGQNAQVFRLLKFRTMPDAPGQHDVLISKDSYQRITALGHVLRRTRLDELPQLINVMRGEMSLVGPRPPQPHYGADYPELYARVLRCRPGLTGLATLHMHGFEARVLPLDAPFQVVDEVYRRRCISRKARLDLIYLSRQSRRGALCFDMLILWRTFWSLFR